MPRNRTEGRELSLQYFLAVASGVPGVAALVGGLIWLGRINEQVTATAARVAAVERDVRALENIKTEVAVIAERTKNTDTSTKEQASDLRMIREHLLDEGRSFARRIVERDAKDHRAS